MYLKHFGFSDPPFSIAPDPRYLYMSEVHREGLAHLLYGLETGGFVLLTGEVGTGKTTLCRCVLEQLPERCRLALVLNPKLTVAELLTVICDELGIAHADDASAKALMDHLNLGLLEAHANGQRTVLVVDEAQNLDVDVLEHLRLLTNLETDRQKLLQIILIGQPELAGMLARPRLRQLSQRITARCHLRALSRREMNEYVAHRLAVSGVGAPIFSAAALRRLHRLSVGVPRLANVICDRALMGAYAEGAQRVGARLLSRAAREVLPPTRLRRWLRSVSAPRAARSLAWSALAAASAAAAVALAQWPEPRWPWLRADAPAAAARAARAAEPLRAPAGYGLKDTRLAAFQALFARWGVDYRPNLHGQPCDHAAAVGLRCLRMRGNLGSLQRLDRPALLGKLRDAQARLFYAALTGLDERRAELTLGTERQSVPVSALERHWFGESLVLWRPPPGYRGVLPADAEGPLLDWLSERRRMLDPEARLPLASWLRDFQRREGLLPDGILGPQTLIHLNAKLGAAAPSLRSALTTKRG